MTKIIFFILACTTCDLEYKYFSKDPFKTCGEQGNLIMSQISKWSETRNGYYTPDNKLVFGYRCE
jgi:hypothetical protein|tara:strand:- start:4876 stop:5070 length:195 start_codon:yes stop_codon:yes gene_type:complete